MPFDLALVMPVYNEEECIVDVIESWRNVLSGLAINFQMIVLNDGSQDGTKDALATFTGDYRIEVINKENSGHGPTILMGYHKAVKLADWVFQCDSDAEMSPEYFPALWEKRERYDALFGVRQGRKQNSARRFISSCSRITVRVLFAKGVADVNTPYRLIRADILRQIVEQMADRTFSPNIIISGALGKGGLRIYNHPVPHQARRTGTVSMVKWKLWQAAVKSFWQTLRCRPVITERRMSDVRRRKL